MSKDPLWEDTKAILWAAAIAILITVAFLAIAISTAVLLIKLAKQLLGW